MPACGDVMVTRLARNAKAAGLPLGIATGVLFSSGFFLYSMSASPYRHLAPYYFQDSQATPEAEDPVWGSWERQWRPPSDDEDWKKINCTVPKMRNSDDFYDYIDRRQLQCHKPVMMGGCIMTGKTFLIGEKWVCMDAKYNITPGSCVALSFGIGNDFSFDDDLDKRFNCTVYSFDPTMSKPTHRRSPNVMFYDLGIADSDRVEKSKKMSRYITILKKLQLQHSVIDYLKIDVEGYEAQFFRDVIKNSPNLLKNVKQIGMEIHASPGVTFAREIMWMYFGFLRCYGFKVMFSEINPVRKLRFNVREKERSCCYEVVWAREKQW